MSRLGLLLLLALASCRALPEEPLVARAYLEADYDAVWERFTRAEAFADWYTSPCLAFDLEPGAELVWGTPEREVYRGRMRWSEKGRGLGWEFRFVGFGFDEAMTPVDFRIEPRGATVLVEIRHDVTGAPETRRIISEVGWTKPLSRLKTLLETGRPMEWPTEANADE